MMIGRTNKDKGGGVPMGWGRDDQHEPSVFRPEGLLREARRQRGLAEGPVPDICLLDPDGDIVRALCRRGQGRRSPTWACYHTELTEVAIEGVELGVVGCAVGAPFAVLVAEQLFASGCHLVISITSAGQIAPGLTLPATILVDRALRGEGTSLAYLPAADSVAADASLIATVEQAVAARGIKVQRGTTWTTDAPFRETPTAIGRAEAAGALAVEMEIAGLYAFARACRRPVVCFALVTNQMARAEEDFEKGPNDGADHALALAVAVARGWQGEA